MKKMKPSALIRAIMASVITLALVFITVYGRKLVEKEGLVYSGDINTALVVEDNNKEESKEEIKEEEVQEETVEEVVNASERVEVFDGLTIEELTDKLDRNLGSDLSGMGYAYANYSIELGVDPYLAVAISMHETGCTWNCSYLAKTCHNVGGMKGSGCGEYAGYDTMEEGIYAFIANIKKNYVDFGLYTADTMNPKYAEDPTWSSKVNKYYEKIKNN